MNDLAPVFVTGIIFWTIYKVFDLFVRRRERQMLIEKINPETSGHIDLSKIAGILNPPQNNRFTALKWASLFLGLGIGLLVYFFIYINCPAINDRYSFGLAQTLAGSLVLIGGGLGLMIAFIIEIKISKHKKREE